MRPQKLEQVVGQAHILGEGKLLQKLVKAGKPFSLIFWGPPGSGKTTLARIIASEMKADFVEISAVMAGKADVTKVVERARRNEQGDTTKSPARTVLFVDEIHTIVGAGAAEGAMDASNMLKPALSRGELRAIGATTLKEFKRYIERDVMERCLCGA